MACDLEDYMGWSLYERLELEVAVERHMLLSSLQSQE